MQSKKSKLSFPLGPVCAILLVASAPTARAGIAEEFEAEINSLTGTELAGATATFSVEGMEVAIVVDGVAFCMPPAPTEPPVADPVAPFNAYGCVNGAEIVGTESGGGSVIDLEMILDPFFVDVTTTRDESIFCGELGGGQEIAEGYATMLVTMTTRLQLNDVDGCIRGTVDNSATNLSISGVDLVSQDNCLNFLDVILPTLTPQLDAQFEPLFEELLEAFLLERNRENCGVSVEASSWSVLKSLFE